MKKIVCILITVTLSLSLVFCDGADVNIGGDPSSRDKVPNPEIIPESAVGYSDYSGLYFELCEVSRVGYSDTLVVDFVNNTDYSVTYGKAYDIEILDGDEWVSVLKEDFAVIEIGCVLSPQSRNEERYSTEYFDMSKENCRYRLVIDAYLQKNESAEHTEVALEFYAGEEADYGESYDPETAAEVIKNSIRTEGSSDFSIKLKSVEMREPGFSDLPSYFFFEFEITNTSGKEITLYIPDDIEHYEYGRWYSVLSADIEYVELERSLPAGAAAPLTVATDSFDMEKPGEYHICKKYKTDSDSQWQTFYIEFEIYTPENKD